MRSPLTGRVVVVSPHVDDAVFSLGATLARAARGGSRVEVLTIFGLDPASEEPANGWDNRAGFATEGDAARARRVEDRAACGAVGAEPSWFPFRGGGYTQERDPEQVWSAASAAIAGADAVLVPGFPLTNPDHAWVSDLFTGRPLPGDARLGLYAEQPYRYYVRRQRKPPREWTSTRASPSEYRLKRRAILAYTSQLPLLGLASRRLGKLDRMLLHEVVQGGETLAWLPKEAGPS